MAWVLANSLILYIAPLTWHMVKDRINTSSRLSEVVTLVIALAVVVHILPECIDKLGWLAIILAFCGFGTPYLIEFAFSRCVPQVHFATKVTVMCGLILHGYLDGALLASILHFGPLPYHTPALIFLFLHKIPESLAVWHNVGGKETGWIAISLLALTNLLGYYLSASYMLPAIPAGFSAGFLAFMVGSLIHLSHQHRFAPQKNAP